jgi:uncharacterized protein (TIGR03118 family)
MQTATYLRAITPAILLALSACSSGDSPAEPGIVTGPYAASFLVGSANDVPSVGNPAANLDANLVNPWGLAFSPTSFAWVANAGTDTSTLYDGAGVLQKTVNVPTNQAPTGVVFNSGGPGTFEFTTNNVTTPAKFIFTGEGGTISAWSDAADTNNAVTVFTSAVGAVYKGLAIARSGGEVFLYATDFRNGRVVTFDKTFTRVANGFAFTDPNLPAGYAPFGIRNLGDDRLVVTYAKQSAADPAQEQTGAGFGLVNVFNADGTFVQRIAGVGGPLNAPWGIARAPLDFGPYSDDLLIGNFGDGTIAVLDPNNGQFIDTLRGPNGTLVLPGLWAIAFGNNQHDQPHTALFFTAGFNNETDGLYGRIDCTGC